MKTLFLLGSFLFVLNSVYAQLYDVNGRYNIEEAYKHYEFICEKYSYKDLTTNTIEDGFVLVKLDSAQIQFSEEGNFYFTMPVNEIKTLSENGNLYTIYISDEATFSVKWNRVTAEFYFEYEQGTNPKNGFRYTLFKSRVNEED